MRITERRLRSVIRSVLKEEYEFNDMNPFSLPPSQAGASENSRAAVDKWLRSVKGQHWWSLARKAIDVRGIEINLTSQDLKLNPKFTGKKCMLSGKPLKPGKIVIIQKPDGYGHLGYAQWDECRKFAFDQIEAR